MMIATINGNCCTTIFSFDCPTNASNEMNLIIFYNELSSLVCSIRKYNVLIISGDMTT